MLSMKGTILESQLACMNGYMPRASICRHAQGSCHRDVPEVPAQGGVCRCACVVGLADSANKSI